MKMLFKGFTELYLECSAFSHLLPNKAATDKKITFLTNAEKAY